MMKCYSVFQIKQKMEFGSFIAFFVNFLRYSFGRIKVILIMVEREYIPDITRQIFFAYQLTGFNMIRSFIERYFLTSYCSYILENHFYFVYAPDYCFKPSLSRIFCVNSSLQYCFLDTKVFRPIYFAHHRFVRSSFTERMK